METTRLLQLGRTHDYIEGEKIVSEDGLDRSLYIIFDGKVGLYRGGLWLNTLETGQHFGLFSMIDGQGRMATAVAESQVRILEIGRNEFVELLRREPSIGVKIVWNLLKDLSISHRQVVSRLLKAMSSERED